MTETTARQGNRVRRSSGSAVLVLALLAAGVLLRPLLIPESHSAPQVLGQVEIGFCEDMAAHHEQALLMVQRLDSGVDPTVRRLAQQIGDAQRMEIGTLFGWLRLANASPDSKHPMAWTNSASTAAHDHSMPAMTAAGTAMPGMATQAELDSLAAARGKDAEILFLQLMLRHHRGGVAMAKAADELIGSGPVKEAARGMITTQSQEAGLMTIMLAQRNAQPLS
ncbi:DUF305 domain-containing protein [Nocardia aurantiaca]|uniref:DUF305 domain-containing protein n=1 Tax=Nocardia aurantiaca TaxID=2675850 RepID=A0A6I3KXT7_9NOCA|nr:DUF305 domain-containing protein [Nocardia aurantiaca]